MKDTVIAFWLIVLVSLFAIPPVCVSQTETSGGPAASAVPAGDLQISLLTDKTVYSIGDEIHFEVTFFNRGTSPFRIMIDDEFIGSEIECTDLQGKRYAYEGGYMTWSPKAGVYTGRTHLLKPDEKMTVRMDALVYDNYRLFFSNRFDRTGSSAFQGVKKGNNLPPHFPDKYVSAGRTFPLLKSGRYRLSYLYEKTGADRRWTTFLKARTPQEASVDLLWTGKTASNSVELLLK